MVTVEGLPNFFRYMNAHYAHWVLVGGCAAWMHLARANRDMTQDPEVYKRIFPDDIDVLIVGDKIDDVEVTVGTRGPLKVEFAKNYVDDATIQMSNTAVIISEGRVLPAKDIIIKYKTGTSKKANVRSTRVYMLTEMLNDREISPSLAMAQYNAPPQLSGIASAAAAFAARRQQNAAAAALLPQ